MRDTRYGLTTLMALLLVLLSVSTLQAESRRSVEKQLKKKLKNKVTYFQTFYRAEKLVFDSAGHLRNSLDATGPWTLYGVIEIKDIKVKKGQYGIRATRGVLVYDGGTYESPRLISGAAEVFIALDTEFSSSQEDFFEKANRVLYAAETPPEEIMPPSYRFYITGKDKDFLEPPTSINPMHREPTPRLPYYVGGEVSRPACLFCPDPSYPYLARQARIEGTVVLWTIIDERGHTGNVRVVKPRGAGLDEAALEAVKKWEFRPAMRYGERVPVSVTVEVSFNLF